jgi:putative transcriptional regulator
VAAKLKEADFGKCLVEGLREAEAWKRGEVGLEIINADPVQATSIRCIHKCAARTLLAPIRIVNS